MSDSLFANSGAITDTAEHDLIAAQGAGVTIYVTDVLVTNSHATVGTLVTLKDNTSGGLNIICQGYAAAAGGGFSHSFISARACGDNKKLIAICGTNGASVYISVSGYKV